MKKLPSIYSVIILFLFIYSCKGQNKTDQPKPLSNIPPPKQVEKKPSDFDPYFIESQGDTSSYGPNSITRNILQDRNGNIWLATWNGIIRYDGKEFINFTNRENLRRHRAFSLLEDSKGILWFGTIGAGVYRYDGKEFTNFTTKDGLVHDGVGCIYEDKAGNIWFGTQSGISRYDASPNDSGGRGKKFQNFTIKDGLPNDDINSIIEDQSGKLWFGSRGKAFIYDPNSNKSDGQGKTFHVIKNNDVSFQNVRCIINDKKGNIWLGGADGLWRYTPNLSPSREGEFTNFTKDFVGYVYEDSKGNIWTSSNFPIMGPFWQITRYDASPNDSVGQEKTLTPTIIKEEANMFFGILEDQAGRIWLGHLRGACRYNANPNDSIDQGDFNCFQPNEINLGIRK